MNRIVSFDVFDTCLMRTCGSPSNMLDVLSLHVFSNPVDDIERHRFIEARRRADSGGANQNIYDIYSELSYSHPSLKPIQDIPAIEMKVERSLLVGNKQIQKIIEKWRNRGAKILFVSDMYLPAKFIKEILEHEGLFQDGDAIYVSNEYNARKSDGSLFQIISQSESVKYSDWHHYGDNRNSDVIIPRKLGIHSHSVSAETSPLQKKWSMEDRGNFFKWEGIMAGMTKAIYNNLDPHFQNKALTDIIAPFCVTFAHRVLNDAQSRGISRLYFCARDSYYVYIAAKALGSLYPNINIQYLYVSQTSLYEGDDSLKLLYFNEIGLASKTDDVAIVDIRSTSRSVKYLNQLLDNSGYKPVFAYYFEVFCNGEYVENVPPFYAEIDTVYERFSNSPERKKMTKGNSWILLEMYFAPHNFPKTVGYELKDNQIKPVFSKECGSTDCVFDDIETIARMQVEVIKQFARHYIFNGLYRYSDDLFCSVVMPSLYYFIGRTDKYYLEGLEHFYLYRNPQLIPYVKKIPIILLPFIKNKSFVWRYGTIVNSLPRWAVNVRRSL